MRRGRERRKEGRDLLGVRALEAARQLCPRPRRAPTPVLCAAAAAPSGSPDALAALALFGQTRALQGGG